MKFTGERDEELLPLTEKKLDWQFFNEDFWSSQKTYEQV